MSTDCNYQEQHERWGSRSALLNAEDCPILPANMYECRVLICPEAEGGYSVHASRIPGVVSEGETLDEALANIADAFRAAIAVYSELGVAVPWEDADIERAEGSFERWILVDA